MLRALYGGSSSDISITSFSSSSDETIQYLSSDSGDSFLLEEVDKAIDLAAAEYAPAPYHFPPYQRLSHCFTAMADLLQVPAGTPGKGLTRQETRIIYVTEAKKENVMDFLNIPSASEVLYFGQEKVALYSTKPRRLRSLPSVLFPITISPLPTLSSSLPPISVLDTRIAPSLLLPTPSRMPSLPSLLSPIPPSTLSKLTPLQSTLEPISASCARLPPLDLTAVAVAATFKNRVAPLPPIRSQAAQQKVDTERIVEHRIILVKEASKENVLSYSDFVSASAPECQEKAKENMDGDATETSSMLASVQEEAEEGGKRKNKRKSLKTRFQNFFRRLNCFCSRTEE